MTDDRPLALVTGASRGIGLAIATALAKNFRLLLVGRHQQALGEAAEQLRSRAAAHVRADAVDLGDAKQRGLWVDSLLGGTDRPHVLVNNAGIAPSAPLTATTDATWAQVLELNLTAPFVLARALAPVMASAGWGRIVNISSTSALKGYSYTCAYSASKGGLLSLTRALAAEYAAKGVTVNAVCPGFTHTDIVETAIKNIGEKTGRSPAEAQASLERFSPLRRLIAPDEVAQLVAYLCTDSAAAITGHALTIDGGETVL